ncbi:MurR/RpiR family transcriptional regulator [Bordetella sp. BOR01]|uniref:MurR/RpiR family transcriptional regulator n=1 Tax=Bordetella sp. BOR01 TaxID=2854779 RepID=UPI001C48C317|nr:MurR/RpiR family transcriptional regulator [Bordetella sp. BOR01]MBV7484826.1 MurR/RpiR family transcriptional regulator [Bordetella sp. BOR01]
MNFLDRIAARTQGLTQSEQMLVDYLVSRQPHGMLDTATVIARKVGISPSTVVRLFSKIGYDSFAEAQREARNEIASKLTSPAQRATLRTTGEQTLQSVVEDSLLLDIDNIQATRASMDMAEFEAIVHILSRPRKGRVFIAGAKNAYGVAAHLHTHLNMCMKDVQLLDTQPSTLADNLLWIDEHDVLVAISIRRYARTVHHAARHFHSTGARVLAITDSPLSPIAGVADHRLLIHTASNSPFDSFTALFSLCTALVSAISWRRKKAVDALLARGDDIWRKIGTFVEGN